MDSFQLFEFLPLWVTFLGTLSIVLISIWSGLYFSRKRKKPDDEAAVGTVVNATLGLLAFILAFTFGITSNRFDSRKQALLDEIAAIETTAKRADLIPESHRMEVRDLIKGYIELRMSIPQNRDELRDRIRQAEDIQRRLWSHAAALTDADLKNADIVSLFVDSLNEMMNFQTRRITITSYHIPMLIWVVLFGITSISMCQVGYLFGKSSSVNWLLIVALSLAFSGVMILIIDLDRSGVTTRGTIQVNQQPMKDLYNRLYGDAPQ
ncbi:MAG TPA: hypothetical protein VLB68_27720 [Pyrinomonadaceae bacterium]|nr:hypothetical protein [Pyrinomonadaceae bacterium]